MPRATLKHKHERFENLLKRFKRAVEKDDTIRRIQECQFYEKPSSVKKRKRAAAKKRTERQVQEDKLRTFNS